MSFFILFFFPLGARVSERKERNVKGPFAKCFKKKKTNQTHHWMPPPNPPSLLLPCLKESDLFLLASFTLKEFFIPSRSWSLTYLSPLVMYKKEEEISQYSFKTIFYKEANKMIYIVSQFNISDICSVIKFTSYICFFKLIHMLPTSSPQLLF